MKMQKEITKSLVKEQHDALRQELLSYRIADATQRVQIINQWKQKVAKLPKHIKNQKDAMNAYITMANASQMIQYADNIDKMENQKYFGIMFDFVGLHELFKEEQYKGLADYFEIQMAGSNPLPNMKFKTSPKAISHEIWKLFKDAQQDLLKRNGKEQLFNLDMLDITKVMDDQLYPIQIQGMGADVNHAVDRTSSSPDGKYPFAHNFGFFLSPGGGMITIDQLKDINIAILPKIKQMLNEHLEEEHGNLYLKAKEMYIAIDRSLFEKRLGEVLTSTFNPPSDKKALIVNQVLFNKLKESFANGIEKLDNQVLLRNMILKIDDALNKETDTTKRKALYQLRASLQVETFALTELYQEAVQYIVDNHEIVELEQYLDTRALGGKQIGHAFILTGQPLENWFGEKIGNYELQYADDLTGSKTKQLTLLELLARTRNIKFSHIALPLAHTEAAFNKGALTFKKVWNNKEYQLAKIMLSSDDKLITPLKALIEKIDNDKTAPEMRKKLQALLETVVELKTKGLMKDNDLIEVIEATVHLLTDVDLTREEYKKNPDKFKDHDDGGNRSESNSIEAVMNRLASAYTKVAKDKCDLSKPSMKKLYVIMLGICALAVALSLFVAPPVAIGVGVGGLLVGAGLFASQKQQHNQVNTLKQAASEVADEAKKGPGMK